MGGLRWAWLVGLVAGVPGCVLSVGDKPAEAPPVTVRAKTASPRDGGFASLPRAPGEWVAKHPSADPPPAPDPPTQPPAVTISVPPVEPPPTPPDSPLVAAVRGAVENRPEETLDALKAFDPAAQKLLLELIPALLQTARFDPARASPHEVGVLVGQFDGLASTLAPHASLLIEKAVLCRSAIGYGVYDPFPDGPLGPGTTAFLYVELRNVPVERADRPDGPRYVTRLGFRMRLLAADGTSVAMEYQGGVIGQEMSFPTVQPFRSPVREYHDKFKVPLPRKPGAYKLEVEFRDDAPGKPAGRHVKTTIHFRVQ